MPYSTTFLADVPELAGETMSMAIAVEGDDVVAYATNGTDDEAYFVGTQTDGRMDLVSTYGDGLVASFDGNGVKGEITMNDEEPTPMTFAATSVASPAGLYTATHDDARASFVVRPDQTIVGVMDNSAPGDHKVTDAEAARRQEFKDQVRMRRIDRHMEAAPKMTYGKWTVDMHGTTVTAIPVTGDTAI